MTQELKKPIPVGRERRRPLPRYAVPLVVAVVIAIIAIVVVLAGLGGRSTRSKQNTGDVGRVGNTTQQNQVPGHAPAGITRHGGGTTP